MLEFEQLSLRLSGSEAELRDLKSALGYENLVREIEELETKASAPGFWDDMENSQKILQRTGKLKNSISCVKEKNSATVFTSVDYATAVELGTSRQKPQPYLSRGIEKAAKMAGIIFREEIFGDD